MVELDGSSLAPQQLPRLLINNGQAFPHPVPHTSILYSLVPETDKCDDYITSSTTYFMLFLSLTMVPTRMPKQRLAATTITTI